MRLGWLGSACAFAPDLRCHRLAPHCEGPDKPSELRESASGTHSLSTCVPSAPPPGPTAVTTSPCLSLGFRVGRLSPWAGEAGSPLTSDFLSPCCCRRAGGADRAGPGQLAGERGACGEQLLIQVSLTRCPVHTQLPPAVASAEGVVPALPRCGRSSTPALPSSRSQSAAVTPSSTASSARATPAPSAPAAASATSPSPAPSPGNGTSTAASPTQPIQLSDLQSILATMNVPAGPGGGQQGDACSSAPGWGGGACVPAHAPTGCAREAWRSTFPGCVPLRATPRSRLSLSLSRARPASGGSRPRLCFS